MNFQNKKLSRNSKGRIKRKINMDDKLKISLRKIKSEEKKNF